jgi:hypothetical protein
MPCLNGTHKRILRTGSKYLLWNCSSAYKVGVLEKSATAEANLELIGTISNKVFFKKQMYYPFKFALMK